MKFTVAYILPSACIEAARRSLPEWCLLGYRVAVLVESQHEADYLQIADVVVSVNEYRGYPWAVKRLISGELLDGVDVVVTGGDDMYPDILDPQQIAVEYFNHFPDGFGVMQPTRDGHGCEDICGSPWMGTEFVRRINGGRGPFWPGYRHYFCDREMKLVTERLGILWQRPDLTQRHEHWSWTSGCRPPHMEVNRRYHEKDRLLFEQREMLGFPGHEPLPGCGMAVERVNANVTSQAQWLSE